ncbi:MAG: hypothetical protein KJ971_00690 [Firmicutes bacterium]|nr:hypothetical protein [Bacillota bacterium]
MGKDILYKDWFKLDNSAKIFPAVSNKRETNTFRVQVILKEEVDIDLLQLAVDAILERYPMFKVRLKTGLFWSYLDYNSRPFYIEPLSYQVCGNLSPKENNGYLFKIFYRNKLIALEAFHSLTDGTGSFMMLKSILYEYFILKGYNVSPDNMILTKDSLPSMEEYEDSHSTYYNAKNRQHVNEKKAFGIKGTPISGDNIGLISGTISTAKMLELARKYQATVTEYMAALMMHTIYVTQIQYREHLKQNQKPVKIFVPVNLRKHFPSKTLRNFSNFVKTDLVMNRSDITFDEILTLTKTQFKQGMTKEELIRKMSENVAFEKNIFLRMTPYFLKKYVLKIGYQMMGLSLNTMSLTNLGKIDFPESMIPYISDITAAVYSGKFNTLNCSIASFGNKFKITFTRSIIETTIEREFFRHFSKLGFEVEIESNFVEEY